MANDVPPPRRLTHDRIWEAIDALAERHGLSPSGLARRAGLDPTVFNPSKRIGSDGRPRWPSTESIALILDATGETVEQFFGYGQRQHQNSLEPHEADPPAIP